MNIRCLPWYTSGCITFISNLFKWYPTVMQRNLHVLEIGGGNSTLFFLSRKCSVVCVESDEAYINSIIGTARAVGYSAQRCNWDELPSGAARSKDSPQLMVFKATSIADMPPHLFGLKWDIIANDGISRHECLEAIVRENQGALIILDNAEFCANWGSLQRSSAYPPRIKAYRAFLRSGEYAHYLFEQGEGRADHSLPDALGWEAPHRWITTVGWHRSHILSRLMVTNIGYPLVNTSGISDEDVLTVRDRCPFNPDSLDFKNTLHLERSFG